MEARSGQNYSNKIAPQVSFFSHCFTFYELAAYFHRRYKFFFFEVAAYFFSSLNYFDLVWLNFFVGSTNEFFHSYCKLFLTGTANYFLLVVLRIIFFIGACCVRKGSKTTDINATCFNTVDSYR